jgi:acetyltransferase-like isoleucine patch superfamily enzyme
MTPRKSIARRAIDRLRWSVSRTKYRRGPLWMSELRKFWVRFTNPQAEIVFDGPVYLGPGFSIHAPNGGHFIVGPGVEFRRNFRAELSGPDARITIGAGSYMTYDVILACSTSIEIGERVGMAQCTFVADGSHRYRDLDKTFLEQGYDYRPIRIADDAQIHSKVTIVADIGERAIIGANAMVTKPIPPYTLAGGVPARVIDYYGPPGMEPEGWQPKKDAAATG